MSERIQMPQVGAQDPQLKNSPIVEEADEEEAMVFKQEVPGEPV